MITSRQNPISKQEKTGASAIFPKAAKLTLIGGMVAILSGCISTHQEVVNIDRFKVAGSQGDSWVYRSVENPETIVTGVKTRIDIDHDFSDLSLIWEDAAAYRAILADSESRFIMLGLGDRATGKSKPIPMHGGPLGWDLEPIKQAVTDSLGVITHDGQATYSLHLLIPEDDARPDGYTDTDVANIRLDRLVSAMVEMGVDPRHITAQVIARSAMPKGDWGLGIALRPYVYGEESTSHRFINVKTIR